MKVLFDRLANRAKEMNPWHLLWITVILSELFTVLCNTIQSYLWWGYLSYDLLAMGSIDALFVSVVVAPLIIFFLLKLNRLRQEIARQKEAGENVRTLNEKLERKVTERTRELVEAQEKLLRSEKLALLGQLGGSIGHELRNPLGVSSNAVYYLKAVIPDAGGPVREYLDIVKAEVDNAQAIIADLLDFTRTRPPRARRVAVGGLINQVLTKCPIPDDINVNIKISSTLPAADVDSLQILQVFQNLVSNALHAMPSGGTLSIKAEERANRQEVTIGFSDTGEGILPENMEKLFEPLFTTKARGIGLGLTTSKMLVEANRGTIEVESRPGSGTTFKVILPAWEGNDRGHESQAVFEAADVKEMPGSSRAV